MNLDPLEVSPATACSVTEMLRNRFASGAAVELVERERIEAVLKEQNFQSERLDSASAVRLGGILNAGKIIFGSLSRLGSSYTISVQMIDTETARVQGIREVLCQRCIEGDLPAAVAALTNSLAEARWLAGNWGSAVTNWLTVSRHMQEGGYLNGSVFDTHGCGWPAGW